MSRTRGYAFTSFNEAEPVWDEEIMTWLIYAPEVCPDTNRDHWQGFVYWKNAKSTRSCSKLLLNVSVFPKARHATFQHQLNYIKGPYNKDGKSKPLNPLFQQYGIMPSPGKRGDLTKLCDSILSGEKTPEDILEENPMAYHQYGRTLNATADLRGSRTTREKVTTGLWLWGETATGKSHHAWSGQSRSTVYQWHDDKGWWDQYAGQAVVIMDDFRGEIKYNYLLQLVDKWPARVSRRGRAPAPFTSQQVIITSSKPPEWVYKRRMAEDSLDQLYRRFTVMECYFDDMGERATRERFAPESEEEEMHFVEI